MKLPPPLRPVAVVHQEGVVGLLAVAGLGIRDGTPLPGLAPKGFLPASLAVGMALGLALAAALWVLERWLVPALRRLAGWQRAMVADWGLSEALAVAAISGLAEEAFARALLQPLLGLLPAAAIFALLHLPPDHRAWVWPLMAFVLGLILGAIFERWGYPAAAAAHAAVNAVGLVRLSRPPSRV